MKTIDSARITVQNGETINGANNLAFSMDTIESAKTTAQNGETINGAIQ